MAERVAVGLIGEGVAHVIVGVALPTLTVNVVEVADAYVVSVGVKTAVSAVEALTAAGVQGQVAVPALEVTAEQPLIELPPTLKLTVPA